MLYDAQFWIGLIHYSALLILEDFYIHTEGKALNPAQRRSSTMVIAEAAARICRGSLQLDKPNSKMISPFLLYLLYRTSDIYAEIYSDTGSEESAGGVRDIKHAMTVLSARWKSAGKCSTNLYYYFNTNPLHFRRISTNITS